MQNPIDFFRTLPAAHGQLFFNRLREYLQVMALEILYKLPKSEHFRFGGGTCLRICHDLPRYSEDLDFSLDKSDLDPTPFIHQLKKGFHQYNVDFEISVPGKIDVKRVAKYWLKFPNLLYEFQLSPLKSEKFMIKLEIDKFPPKKGKGEFFYVTKFKQYFPIYKNDLPTLFSGKIAAVCHRLYYAMRDFYDILWYLNKGIEPNYEELHELGIFVRNKEEIVHLLKEHVSKIDGSKVLDAIQEFLENPDEKKILLNYGAVFKQASQRYLSF